MADLKQLEEKIEELGHEFNAIPNEERIDKNSAWRTQRNKLAKLLWEYSEKLQPLKYQGVNEFDFYDSISDSVCDCLKQTPNSWVKEFKTILRNSVFKTKDNENKRGITKVSNDVIKLGRELEKWARWKNSKFNITHRNSADDEKLFEYGRLWGKSDVQIQKALDWLTKKNFIEGNALQSNDDSNQEIFDSICNEDLLGFTNDSEIHKEKIILYIKAANSEYDEKKQKAENSKKLGEALLKENNKFAFYSKWVTNIIIAALLKENVSGVDITKLLEQYEIVDKTILKRFNEDIEWKPNTDRKAVGMECGIAAGSIGQTDDRFRADVMERYKEMLEKDSDIP